MLIHFKTSALYLKSLIITKVFIIYSQNYSKKIYTLTLQGISQPSLQKNGLQGKMQNQFSYPYVMVMSHPHKSLI
jgi:hypothetical protein